MDGICGWLKDIRNFLPAAGSSLLFARLGWSGWIGIGARVWKVVGLVLRFWRFWEGVSWGRVDV